MTKPSKNVIENQNETPEVQNTTDSAQESAPVEPENNETNPTKPEEENVPETKPEVTESANMKRAKEVFTAYHTDKVFFTEDGTAFLQEQHARMHAENLKKPGIETITRKETE